MYVVDELWGFLSAEAFPTNGRLWGKPEPGKIRIAARLAHGAFYGCGTSVTLPVLRRIRTAAGSSDSRYLAATPRQSAPVTLHWILYRVWNNHGEGGMPSWISAIDRG